MDVFQLRDRLIGDYSSYVRGFIHIRDKRIRGVVESAFDDGLLWPEPLIQLNPAFEAGASIDELVAEGVLHPGCASIFRRGKSATSAGEPLRLHRHQEQAIRAARQGRNYVLTTGTGSGKSLAYNIPIVDYVLRHRGEPGIKAIVVYPMNALANSQLGELEKFLRFGLPAGAPSATFERYTGQESQETRERITQNPPDILLTNFVMLELILTRVFEQGLVGAARGLKFLVLDELHTYRGRQGADVALLVRRAREALHADSLQCVGTSATIAAAGSHDEQRAEVARVASLLFGATVEPGQVIGETLSPASVPPELADPAFIASLTARVGGGQAAPTDFQAFVADPLSRWLERELGLREDAATARLVRAEPRGIGGDLGIADELSQITGVDRQRCATAIRHSLLVGYYCPNPRTDLPTFAFRLHQFISRGDTAYASPELEADRDISLDGQIYVPGDRGRVRLPLAFCRECGQEYFVVRSGVGPEGAGRVFTPRELRDRSHGEEMGEAGFLYLTAGDPWPADQDEMVDRLPEDWVEEHRGGSRVRRSELRHVPEPVWVLPDGSVGAEGVGGHFVKAPLRLCLRCGVEYGPRESSDFGKLATLTSEGRSTATSVLSLSTILALRSDESLPEQARKLLSFTDNRQDASLQAGHFNDFVEIGVLRASLYRALEGAGPAGLEHDALPGRVLDALGLDVGEYAANAEVRYAAADDARRAMRDVLAYWLYQDQRRGWRVNAPNLEQCGLLEIRYRSLEQVCADDSMWLDLHPALVGATPEKRLEVAKALLDTMRRGLAIAVDYLRADLQDRIAQRSRQELRAPWALDENESESLRRAAIAFPRPRRKGDRSYDNLLYLSPRSAYGQYLARALGGGDRSSRLSVDDRAAVIAKLLEVLARGGLVRRVVDANTSANTPGYQIPASALVWLAGDGSAPAPDPQRIRTASAEGGRTNPYFVNLYRRVAQRAIGIEAREHTAQVPSEQREDRERDFRAAKLAILYCSPTMELGVDIAELNVVNMRNVPPTPANYAQRSGRAGRSGQPALVFNYCTTGSPHDQYFFKRPQLMVAGSVVPPRLDVANVDLVRAHVQAIWLAEASLDLGKSLKHILDVNGAEPSLEVLEGVRARLGDHGLRERARGHAARVLATIGDELETSDWWDDTWLAKTMDRVPDAFEAACERWRSLYRVALGQAKAQDSIVRDASRPEPDRKEAERLRAEAEAQLKLLADEDTRFNSDFYSYRYFASEGFLPGYNFPRLPLSAFIPGRRGIKGTEEYLSRPRFIAISEFGPRSFVYHEGSRYITNRVMLPFGEQAPTSDEPAGGTRLSSAKQCGACGYLHPFSASAGPDTCERCRVPLPAAMTTLFRLRSVSTRRRDRITSDEEERLRMGYEVRSGVRFEQIDGVPSHRQATVQVEDGPIAKLTYGQAATLWRMNLGWRRRTNKEQLGFILDLERGYWARGEHEGASDPEDPLSKRTQRVVPFVEDRRNALLVEPVTPLDIGEMASLGAALDSAIRASFQLEDNELAVEFLPTDEQRNLLLLYEAAEGGAGVLRRLVSEPDAVAAVAHSALELCHFDPASGEDRRRAEGAREDCEAACYDCLMSYSNQLDHRMVDRHRIRDLLLSLTRAQIHAGPTSLGRPEHLSKLLARCASELERSWLERLESRLHTLPSAAQVYIAACSTKADFVYESEHVAVFVDGPHHDYPEYRDRDAKITECLEDDGYTVVRFHHRADWDAILAQLPGVFGRPAP